MISEDIKSFLFDNQDLDYREFISKINPQLNLSGIVGVRTPILRKYTKDLQKRQDLEMFLEDLPHEYYEENQIHSFILSSVKDFDKLVEYLDIFLPYMDNWATCDSLSPKIFAKNLDALIPHIEAWIASKDTYTVRFAILCLMNFYLDKSFKRDYIDMVCQVQSDQYYINMMRAWYFATALAKQYDVAVEYMENERLDKWTHNKAIQKAIESFRVNEDHKVYLKSLRRKI